MRLVRHQTAESSPARRLQPAARAALFLGVAAALLGVPAGRALAQQTVTIGRSDAVLLAAPRGVRLGRVTAGATFRATGSRDGSTQLAVDGWIPVASVRAVQRDGHNLAVSAAAGQRLHAGANGPVVGVLVRGALLDEVERRSGWVHVRRAAWVSSSALRASPAPSPTGGNAAPPAAPPSTAAPPAPATARPGAAAAPPAAGAARGDTGAAAGDPRLAVVRQRVALRRAPNAPAAGTLEAETPVRIAARAWGWVRVEAQGWVRESDLRPLGGAALDNVTAAELRAEPDRFRGQLLRWTIQFIALQTADELRPDFTPGERYILARGPAPEYAFAYVVVPADQAARVARIAPLATVTVLARVRSGSSAFLANPILELVDIVP